MQLQIDGAVHSFIPLKRFCADFDLPEMFSVEYFTPKDWTGLGRIDSAGAALNSLRVQMLAAIPARLSPIQWMNMLPGYVRQFEVGLRSINPQVGLRESEIEFAVSGFSDVLNAHASALIGQAGQAVFARVYEQWLWDSVRVFSEGHTFNHRGESWMVHIISHAYGRVGLRVTTTNAIHYVYDPVLACPAEGFMHGLLEAVATQIETVASP
jgi:hypothetical protein